MEKFEKEPVATNSDASAVLLESVQSAPQQSADTTNAIARANAQLQGRFEQSQRSLSELGISLTQDQQAQAQNHLRQLSELQSALISGDHNRLHKFIKDLKDPLPKIAEAVQGNLRNLGASDITLDLDDRGQLIVFFKGQNQAMLFSKEKVDVIGFNSDGSFNYGARFPGEDNHRSMQQLAGKLVKDLTLPPTKATADIGKPKPPEYLEFSKDPYRYGGKSLGAYSDSKDIKRGY